MFADDCCTSRKGSESREPNNEFVPAEPPPLPERGIAVGDLNPTGVISIDGNEHPAKSEGGFIQDGTTVAIVRRDVFEFVVRPINEID